MGTGTSHPASTRTRAIGAALLIAAIAAAIPPSNSAAEPSAPPVLKERVAPSITIPFDVRTIVEAGGQHFFVGYTRTTGREIYRLEPDTGEAILVADIAAGSASSHPRRLVAAGDDLYFVATDMTGWELWKVETSTGRTTLVADVYPGDDGAGGDPGSLTALGEHLYFVAHSSDGGTALWSTDLDSGATTEVPGLEPSDGPAVDLTAVGDHLVFHTYDDVNGPRIWTIEDGTAQPLGQVLPDSDTASLGDFTAMGGVAYSVVHTSGPASDTLWRIDPTTGQMGPVESDPARPEPGDIWSSNLLAAAGSLYFPASTPEHGWELWSYAPGAPPAEVADLNPGPDGSVRASRPTFADGRVFFTADDGATGYELWQVAVSTGDVSQAIDLAPGTDSSYATGAAAVGDAIVFHALPPDEGPSLWKLSAGHSASLFADFVPGPDGAGPLRLAVIDSAVYVSVDGRLGREMWRIVESAGDVTASEPIIFGKPRVGRVLQLEVGAPLPGSATPAIQWLRNDVPVVDATTTTFRLRRVDRGARISARVTWSLFGHRPSVASTKATAPIRPKSR